MNIPVVSASTVITLLVAASVIGVGFHTVTTTSGSVGDFWNQSEDWCNAHGGELQNSRVIGDHGGLHCELPNGTSVHMHDVIEVNQNGE